MFGDHFYNKSVRNTVIAFGSLFNQLKVKRIDGSGNVIKQIQVPISYGNKSKFIRKIREDYRLSDPDQTQVSMTLPRIGFELTSVEYDTSRKMNTLGRRRVLKPGSDEIVLSNFNPVPYILNFGMYLMSETVDDGLQMLEQITPYFTPEFTVSLNLISELHEKVDVPITLNSTTVESEYEGDFDNIRNVMWVLDFSAKSYMYSPVKEVPITKRTVTVLYDSTVDDSFSGLSGALSRINVTTDPEGATFGSDYEYNVDIRVRGMTGDDGIDGAGNTL
jgi:hypothetical protein